MVIRLRQIEQHKPKSREQVKKEEVKRNANWKSTKLKVILIIIAIISLVTIVIRLKPVSAKLIAGADIIEVHSPVNAKVIWLAKDDRGNQIKAGDKIAILQQVPGDLAEENRVMEKLKADKQLADLALHTAQFKLNEYIKKSSMERNNLSLAVQLCQKENESAVNIKQLNEHKLETNKKSYEQAKKLWNLDSLSKTELDFFKHQMEIAESELQKYELLEAAAIHKQRTAIHNLTEFDLAHKKLKEILEKSVKISKANVDHCAVKVKDLEDVLNNHATKKIELTAPINGCALSTTLDKGEIVLKGETAFSIFKKDSLELFAYVPENDKSRVSLDQVVDIRIDKRTLTGKVKAIDPKIILSPPSLRIRGSVSQKAYFMKVTIEPDKPETDIFPGQVGKVIFK